MDTNELEHIARKLADIEPDHIAEVAAIMEIRGCAKVARPLIDRMKRNVLIAAMRELGYAPDPEPKTFNEAANEFRDYVKNGLGISTCE